MQDDPPDSLQLGSAAGSPLGSFASDPERPPEADPFRIETGRRYEPGPVLGVGGMGVVTAAVDRRLDRSVAFKALAPGVEAEARLAREARITAHLEHPGIVPLYDAGRTADGRLYYTMRLVRGRSLAVGLAEAHTLEDRLKTLRSVLDACDAMAYAHSAGVIHRDLKPENIMVGSFGETQIVDWGLACRDDEAEVELVALANDGVKTQLGAVVGTPAYMAPDQARGERADTRSDVFSLGAILFEVLTGEPPYGSYKAQAALKAARRNKVSDTFPQAAPSALVAIVRKALAPKSTARYPSAAALAADLSAFMDGRRVDAHQYSTWELVSAWSARHRIALFTALAGLVILAVALVTGYQRTAEERDRALEAEAAAQLAAQAARTAEAATRVEEQNSNQRLGHALLQSAHLAAERGERPEAETLAAHALVRLGTSPHARGILSQFAATPRPQRIGGMQKPPGCLSTRLSVTGDRLLCLGTDTTTLYSIPDGRPIWTLDQVAQYGAVTGDLAVLRTGEFQLNTFEAGTGAPIGEVQTVHDEGPYLLAPRTGEFIAKRTWFGLTTAGRAPSQSLRLCEKSAGVAISDDGAHYVATCQDGEVLAGTFGHPPRTVAQLKVIKRLADGSSRLISPPTLEISQPFSIGLAPDAKTALIGTLHGELLHLELTDGQPLSQHLVGGGPVQSITFSPGGQLALIRTERAAPRLWSPTRGFVGVLPRSTGREVVFRDDTTLVSNDRRGVSVWRLPAAPAASVLNTGHGISSVAVSRTGQFVVSADGSGYLTGWDRQSGTRLFSHRPLGELVIKDVTFAHTANTILAISLGTPGGVEVPIPHGKPTLMTAPQRARRLVRLRDGTTLFNGFQYVSRRNAGRFVSGPGRPTAAPSDVPPKDLEIDHNARYAIVLWRDGLLERFEAGVEETTVGWANVPGASAAAIARNGNIAFAASNDAVHRLDISGPSSQWLNAGVPTDIALSVDDRYVAVGMLNGTVRIFEADSGVLVAEAQAHRRRVGELVFTPDGSELISAGWDQTVRRWSLAALQAGPDTLLAQVEGAWALPLSQLLTQRLLGGGQ